MRKRQGNQTEVEDLDGGGRGDANGEMQQNSPVPRQLSTSHPASPSSSSSSSDGSGGKRTTLAAVKTSTSTGTTTTTTTVARAAAAGPNINPRTHSVRGISRAKIKTIKLTVVVIVGYIACSAPFICVQLWATWGTPSDAVMGSLAWLFWLLTLNSVVNPWIYMFFNVNMVETLWHFCCCCCNSPDCGDCLRKRNNQTNQLGAGYRGVRTNQSTMAADAGGQNSRKKRLTDRIIAIRGGGGANASVTFHNNARSRSNTGGSGTSLTMLTTTVVCTNGNGSNNVNSSSNNALLGASSSNIQPFKDGGNDGSAQTGL